MQTNLTVLTRLQSQLEQLNLSRRDAENRKLIIQQQIADAEGMRQRNAQTDVPGRLTELELATESNGQGMTELQKLKNELAVLQNKYTDNHPDVRRLKGMIANLESQQSVTSENGQRVEKAAALESQTSTRSPAKSFKYQLDQVNMEIESLKDKIAEVTANIDLHQKRVDAVPQREQELMSLSRDYENLKHLYDSLLTRKLEAEMAVSLERKQKGEQFRMIDPAQIPESPVEPDMKKILMLTLALGLGLGGGLAYLVEAADTSYKNPQELEKELELPVLVSVPIRFTKKELKMAKIRETVAYGSICAGFVFSAIAIVVGVKGVDKTVELVRGLVEKI